jgi:hypothetical protein
MLPHSIIKPALAAVVGLVDVKLGALGEFIEEGCSHPARRGDLEAVTHGIRSQEPMGEAITYGQRFATKSTQNGTRIRSV